MRERIDSMSNKKMKLVSSLKQRKYREKEGLFLAEGIRLCEMAAEAGWGIRFGLYTKKLLEAPRGAALAQRLEESGCSLYEVPEPIFAKTGATDSPQGILLVIEKKRTTLEDLLLPEKPSLLVVLDGVQDPGNTGTMIRTADAAGADGVLLLDGCVDVYSDKTVRAAMGSLFHLPVCQGIARENFLAYARNESLTLYAAALDASAKQYHEADFSGRVALVFGNEANGASQELLHASETIYIPMYGRAESLNVATAAAVVLYEAARQRSGLQR